MGVAITWMASPAGTRVPSEKMKSCIAIRVIDPVEKVVNKILCLVKPYHRGDVQTI
jgi:hypothetical protein